MNSTLKKRDWKKLCEKYMGRCAACLEEVGVDKLVRARICHELPYTLDNVQPLCLSCNSKQGSRTICYKWKFESK